MKFHFLNVKEGACSIVEHASGRISVIDICNGNEAPEVITEDEEIVNADFSKVSCESANPLGNYNQKAHPTNSVDYMSSVIKPGRVFRFILTHPDMDHMDGLQRLFKTFKVENFWCTDCDKPKPSFESGGAKYNEADWNLYELFKKKKNATVDGTKIISPLRGAIDSYWAKGKTTGDNGDGLTIISPSQELLDGCGENYNNTSYVVLYTTPSNRKILFPGDSESAAWSDILDEKTGLKDLLKDIDILIAPHHGRSTGGSADYLETLNPKLTLFGNAKSRYLDYDKFGDKFQHVTSNEMGNILVEERAGALYVYGAHKKFVEDYQRKLFGEKYPGLGNEYFPPLEKHSQFDMWLYAKI